MKHFAHYVAMVLAGFLALLQTKAFAADGDTLMQIRARGVLRCGVSERVDAGFRPIYGRSHHAGMEPLLYCPASCDVSGGVFGNVLGDGAGATTPGRARRSPGHTSGEPSHQAGLSRRGSEKQFAMPPGQAAHQAARTADGPRHQVLSGEYWQPSILT